MAEESEPVEPVRFVYNLTPNSKILQAKSAIPAALHYTPQEKMEIVRLDYIPITCQCETVMNFYCPINFQQKTVRCCVCGNTTPLPPNYAQHIEPHKLPFEFMQKSTTLQFRTGAKVKDYRSSYIFVLDINLEEKELAAIRQELAAVVAGLPDSYNVGLVTFGKNVKVYELASRINTNFCINGCKQYNVVSIMELLGIQVKSGAQSQNSDLTKRFVVPLSTYRDIIVSRIKNIKPANEITVNERKHCCFGQALNISISMAEVNPISSRIVYMSGNPCTVGPGMTISTNFKEQMRSPEQLNRGQNLGYFATAKNYYDSFIKRVMARQIVLDMFIFTCNEIGFTEMSELFISSGGFVVMHEEFRDRIFRDSFPKIFENVNQETEDNHLNCVTEVVVHVYCSKQLSINGAFGQCYSLNKPKPFISDKVVGKGKTHAWYLGSADSFKTITIVYQTKQAQAKEQYYYFQLKTTFRNKLGQLITRITTVRREWTNLNQRIIEGFDEEAAAVLTARQCVHKMLYEEQKNIRQWVDHALVKWAQLYANYAKNDESSFSLPQQMRLFPQLLFNLRRSHFVNRFGISLDESFYKGYCMNRESVVNCLSMIQPALLSYSLENESVEPVAVALDEEEMKDDVVLLLDTYFVVVEWYGSNVKSWEESNYHETEGYEHIAELLNSPKIDIDFIMKYRFPVPNYYRVFPYHSKERYLKSRVNPKKGQGEEHENMLTDDSNLKGFTQHLIKVVVKQA